jgi:adenylosuccinate synthase
VGSLEVVVGGQFGSEGKGAIAAWRSKYNGGTLLAVRVAGPNAGHTVIGPRGIDTTGSIAPNLCEPIGDVSARRDGPGWSEGRFAWRLRQVPVAAVVNRQAVCVLAAGSEIDWPVLLNEINMLDAAGYDVSTRLLVDEQVTLIEDRHKYEEKYGRGSFTQQDPRVDEARGIATGIGSTGKGIGAARADRIWREPSVCLAGREDMLAALRERGVVVTDVALLAAGLLRSSKSKVVIEGTQGYGLGLHAGYYPYGTSSDCRAIDFLAMAGISPWQVSADDLTVWVCLRPYPIRVGGNSGPLANETSWNALGLPEEHTTVTGKVRRVGEWDGKLARNAILANGGPSGPVKIALTMMDYLVPEIAGWTSLPEETEPTDAEFRIDPAAVKASSRLREEVAWLSRECQQPIAVVGTGPDTVLELT